SRTRSHHRPHADIEDGETSRMSVGRTGVQGALVALLLTTGGASFGAQVDISQVGHAYNPAWSMDGKWLAFELNQYEGSVDLYVVQVDGTRATTSPMKVALPGSTSAFSTQASVAASPSWHPGGQ